MKLLSSLAVSGALTVAGNAVWHAGNLNPADYAPVIHSHTGYATAAQGTKADNALPATSYTAADVLSKLLAVDTDTAGINATTVKSIQPGAGGLVLLAQANLGSGWTTKLASAPPTTLAGWGITDAAASNHSHTFASLTSKPTTRSGYGITDAAANVHYHTMSDISDFSAPKGKEYFASPINGSVTANVNSYAGVIARMNGDVSLNFSGTIYGDYEIMIYNDTSSSRNLDLNFYNSVQTIKGSAGSTSITINPGQMYRGRFHYIYAGSDGIMGVADVN